MKCMINIQWKGGERWRTSLSVQFSSLYPPVPAVQTTDSLSFQLLIKPWLCSAPCEESNTVDSTSYVSRSDSMCVCVLMLISHFLSNSTSSLSVSLTVILIYLPSVTHNRGFGVLISKPPQSIISPQLWLPCRAESLNFKERQFEQKCKRENEITPPSHHTTRRLALSHQCACCFMAPGARQIWLLFFF